MFGAVLTAGYTALLVYVLWRGRSVPLLTRHLSHRRSIALGGALWLLFLLARTVGHGGTGFVASTLDGAGTVLLGAVFLILVALLVLEVATGFGLLLPGQAPTLRGYGAGPRSCASCFERHRGSRSRARPDPALLCNGGGSAREHRGAWLLRA